MNMIEDVREFHERFGIDYDGKPRFLPEDLLRFRLKFLHEELVEYHLHQLPHADGMPDDDRALDSQRIAQRAAIFAVLVRRVSGHGRFAEAARIPRDRSKAIR